MWVTPVVSQIEDQAGGNLAVAAASVGRSAERCRMGVVYRIGSERATLEQRCATRRKPQKNAISEVETENRLAVPNSQRQRWAVRGAWITSRTPGCQLLSASVT